MVKEMKCKMTFKQEGSGWGVIHPPSSSALRQMSHHKTLPLLDDISVGNGGKLAIYILGKNWVYFYLKN